MFLDILILVKNVDIFYILTDSSCSLDESFGSDGQIRERVKDINIVSKEHNTKVGHGSKMKEIELRQSIKEKLCATRKDENPSTRNTDSRPGVSILILPFVQLPSYFRISN